MICVIYGMLLHSTCASYLADRWTKDLSLHCYSQKSERRDPPVWLSASWWIKQTIDLITVLWKSCNYLIDCLFMKVYDFALDEDDMTKLDGLNRDLRVYAEPMWVLIHFLALKIIRVVVKITNQMTWPTQQQSTTYMYISLVMVHN